MPNLTTTDIETIATDISGAEDGWIYLVSPGGEKSQYVKLPGRPLGIAIDRNENLFVWDWDAHPDFGGRNLDELYITNLMGNSVNRVKGVPQGQKLYHQMH